MIYISSSCIKGEQKISEVVRKLPSLGFFNIELSGGTEYYTEFESDLLAAQKETGTNLLCHNYFPPPPKAFVLNLASLNDEIHGMTMSHFKNAIDLSEKLGAKKFGLHAGFYTDILLNQIGKNILKQELYDKEKCFSKFCRSFEELLKYANGRVELYIENNVIAQHNFDNYDHQNIFMLTTLEEYHELKKHLSFKILLDVAHLYVSANTLKIPFMEQARELWNATDYIHISDNDGLKDLNWAIQKGSPIYQLLKGSSKEGKIFTFEVYRPMEEIKESLHLFEEK